MVAALENIYTVSRNSHQYKVYSVICFDAVKYFSFTMILRNALKPSTYHFESAWRRRFFVLVLVFSSKYPVIQ